MVHDTYSKLTISGCPPWAYRMGKTRPFHWFGRSIRWIDSAVLKIGTGSQASSGAGTRGSRRGVRIESPASLFVYEIFPEISRISRSGKLRVRRHVSCSAPWLLPYSSRPSFARETSRTVPTSRLHRPEQAAWTRTPRCEVSTAGSPIVADLQLAICGNRSGYQTTVGEGHSLAPMTSRDATPARTEERGRPRTSRNGRQPFGCIDIETREHLPYLTKAYGLSS